MTAPMPSDAEIDRVADIWQDLVDIHGPHLAGFPEPTEKFCAVCALRAALGAVRGLRARGRAWYAEAADQNHTAQLDATRPVILAAIRLVDGITVGNSGSSALVKAVRDMAGQPAAAEFFDSAEVGM